MYTEKKRLGFSEVAESLKKYRRADLVDQNGQSVLDELYVDLLEGNAILSKCLLNNTTFLIGRKGTGKSTIFLKLENEYRKMKGYLPCYVDVKTVYESSQATAINQGYLNEYFDSYELRKYLMGRSFIQSVLKQVYEEIDKQHQGLIGKIVGAITGINKSSIKAEIQQLIEEIDDNEVLKSIEIPILQQVKKKHSASSKSSEEDAVKIAGTLSLPSSNELKGEGNQVLYGESGYSNEDELINIYLKVFEVKKVINKLKSILSELQISHFVILLDDVSEIDGDALRLFVDTIVAPLNNWSDEFIKFKIAFYPGRVHFGKIDPGKVDVINLDFYNLYSEFDISRIEENAINFTNRLLSSRFEYYTDGIEKYFDAKPGELYELFFRVSMNVPRIMGYILSYLHQSSIIYGKKISKSDIENASVKYYDEKIDAFFKSSTYCLLTMQERRDITQLKKIRDALVDRAKEIKRQITLGELTGKTYQKSHPYSSHFHVLKESDKYIDSLELNHFITKYEERSNRDGKQVNIYCINYGLAKKNNIVWGKPKGLEYRTYFIERPFNYTSIILEQIKAVKIIKCSNPQCGRIFSEDEQKGLEFTHYKCPDCNSKVITETRIDPEIEQDLKEASKQPAISKDELLILLELHSQAQPVFAKDIAGEVDMNSHRVSKICKKMDEEKGLVVRNKCMNPYKYSISDQGKHYCII